MRMRLVIVAALASMHCASSQRAFDTQADAGPPPEGNLGDGGVESGPEPIQGECTDENKQVYVVSTGGKTLYRFDPPALTFTKIGDIHCPTSADTFSMAVDRRGIAWVEYTDGQIFHVSTVDASCTETTFPIHQAGFTGFGMGFAKDSAQNGETLYISGEALGIIDTKTLEVSVVGPGVGLAELTGTGNGQLYAFVAANGRVVQLDRATGKATSVSYRTSAVSQGSWAFAQWGGDFWLFTGATVTRYQPASDTSTEVIHDAGFAIVGAGVSTCAPFEPPH